MCQSPASIVLDRFDAEIGSNRQEDDRVDVVCDKRSPQSARDGIEDDSNWQEESTGDGVHSSQSTDCSR